MAHAFNRVGNAPRFVFQISNLKFQIRNFKYNNRGPLGTRLNEPMPTACGIALTSHLALTDDRTASFRPTKTVLTIPVSLTTTSSLPQTAS